MYIFSSSRNGPFPFQYWPWYDIGTNMQLCLAGLRDVDRLVLLLLLLSFFILILNFVVVLFFFFHLHLHIHLHLHLHHYQHLHHHIHFISISISTSILILAFVFLFPVLAEFVLVLGVFHLNPNVLLPFPVLSFH